jgi:thiamine-phosphate pyrophosphorylase
MLIVISHNELFAGEASLIQQLFEEGMPLFHLRKPQATEAGIRQLLDAVPAVYRDRIALHGFHHLANEYGISRLHFPEYMRTDLALTELHNQGYLLSTSVHDLVTLQQLPSLFAYTFFSPVFNSISKQQYKGVAGDDFRLPSQKPVPVIALGGINETNIHKVVAMHFNGAALLGAIWREPRRAVERFTAIRRFLHSKVVNVEKGL